MGIFTLPDGYSEIRRVNMQKDKKIAILINVGALVIAVLLFIAGYIFVPFEWGNLEIVTESSTRIVNLLLSLLSILAIIPATALYIVGHELTHGAFIKIFSGKKAKYGFTGLYAYAGSDAFFNRRQYIIIALAPIIIFGVLLLLLNILLPNRWFWFIYNTNYESKRSSRRYLYNGTYVQIAIRCIGNR